MQFLRNIFFLMILITAIALPSENYAQSVQLNGTVYDYFSKKPLDAVTVYTTSGNYTITDSLGKYAVSVDRKDSVWFSYFSKQTMKYPVDTISNFSNFEVALYVDVAWLPEIKVRNKDYKLDSIQNRQDYAKIFNFQKPGLKTTTTNPSSYVPGSVTASIDLDELINMFRFKRNRQLLSFQERLLQQEQDKYVDHRFTKRFVRQLTQLEVPELDTFMSIYRPDYYELLNWNDIDLGEYIQQSYKNYLYVKKYRQ